MFRFRKIFTHGPFRTTWNGKRFGWSFGIPGCRLGFGIDGGLYLTFGIPGTGVSYTKKIGKKKEIESWGFCGHFWG